MIHITDGETGKILSFIPLGDFWNDIHSKSLKDNQETYDFTTFADRKYSEFLTDRNRVVIPDEDNNFIELIIENSREYRSNNALYTQVYTTASYLQLKKAKVIEPQTFKDQTISTIMAHTLAGTEFQAGILEGMGTRTFVVEDYTNPYAFINTIANEFSLEKRFRIVVNNNKVVARYVDLLKREGEWRGREVEFGKDLIGIERKEDNSNIVTALLGIGPEKEDGTRLTALVTDDEALQRWGRPDPDTGKLMHLIEPYEPTTSNSDMTLDELTQYTRTELDKRINTIVEYSGEVADLEHIPGLENKKIRFGDTIKIKDTKFKPPLYLEARVHTMERSLSDKSQKKVTLGDFIEYTEEDVKAIWKSLQSEINKKLTYIWVRYSQYPDGSGMTEDSTNASYMGVAITKTDAAPENPEDYTWTLIKGEKGEDGTSSYTHIAYADNETGTVGFTFTNTLSKAYIGMYVDSNPVASTDPTKYKWTLVKGADGSQGIPGPPGEDGRTPYFHVAYANNATGTVGFSTTDSTNKLYIGQYTDFNSPDSTDPSKYKWTKIKGDPGPQGIQGPKGADGQTLYTWIKYADTPTSGMSNFPDGKKYMGIAYNKTTPTESTNYADYTWTLVKGEPGIPGPPGEDGTTTYTWIKYADDDKGNGMSDSPDGKRYLGLAYNKTTATESTNPADYNWSPLYDNVIPGGKNYLRYSDFNTTHGWTAWNKSGTLSVASVPGFPNDLLNQTRDSEVPANSAIGVHNSSISEQGFSVVGGKDYTVSYYIRARGLVSMNYCYLLYNDGGSNQLLPTVKFEDCPIVKLNGYDYHYVTHHFKANRDGTGVRLLIGGRSDALYGPETTIPYFYLNRPQLEDGNVASPWGLAQKDVEEKIAQAEQNAKDASVGLGNLYNGFKVTKEEGMEIMLSNGLVRTIANATGGFKIQRRATTSSPWLDMFYADTNGKLYTIDGVFSGELQAATGTFGEVTAKDGLFNVEDSASGTKYSIVKQSNLVDDHSFELVGTGAERTDSTTYMWLPMVANENSAWVKYGNPMVGQTILHGPTPLNARAIFGNQAIVVNSTNYVYQDLSKITEGTYTLSAYAKRQYGQSPGALRLKVIYKKWNGTAYTDTVLKEQTFTTEDNAYTIKRRSTTFTVPSDFTSDSSNVIRIIISTSTANWLQVDGVQVAKGDLPSLYDTEDNVWNIIKGNFDILKFQNILWNGVMVMNGSQSINLTKPISQCQNGIILVWSNYSNNTGNNWNFVYSFVPRTFFGMHTLFQVPVSEANQNLSTIKALSITDTRITGVANNQTGINSTSAVLRYVLEF
ncbi:phage tail spike protein [Lysinibacillus halotolerans]